MSAAPHGLRHHAPMLGVWRDEILAWWSSLPATLRSPSWPAALACLTILALLLGFHQVVANAVQQGQVFRTAAATRADAVARCNALRAPRVRASCLEQLDAPPVEQAGDPAPPNTAALALAKGR